MAMAEQVGPEVRRPLTCVPCFSPRGRWGTRAPFGARKRQDWMNASRSALIGSSLSGRTDKDDLAITKLRYHSPMGQPHFRRTIID